MIGQLSPRQLISILRAEFQVPDTGLGAPAYNAPEGTLYWDITNNDFYANNNGAAGWTLVGGAGLVIPHQLLDNIWHSDTVTTAPLRGAIVVADATPQWNRVVHPGGAGYALTTTANDTVWDQTPAWTGRHSFAAGITFNGAGGANDVIVPDNTSQAMELEDAGGLEYLRIITSDVQPVVQWNFFAADIDFHVSTAGPVVDALQVRGSDGQITLGALGAGFVQSTAGGVLSSAAIGVGDLPAHGTTHDVGAADPVTTTSDGETTPSTILAADANGRLRLANIGLGVAPSANYGVQAATAGAVSAIYGAETSGIAVQGIATSGTGASFRSATGTGLVVNLTGVGTIADFNDNGASILTIQDGGNILLGATGTLDLNGIADALILDADGDTTISAPTDDQIDFEVSGGDAMVLTATGLGINTVPSWELHAYQAAANADIVAERADTPVSGTLRAAVDKVAIGARTNHPVNFLINNAAVGTLDVSGHLGVNGITAPSTALDIGAGAIEGEEMTAPGAGAANTWRMYGVDNGGKTEVYIIFNTGAAQLIAAQP